MNLPPGLVAIPPGIDVACLFDKDTALTPKQFRERAFVMLNELAATYAPDAEGAALAKLAAVLGDEHAVLPAVNEFTAVKARRHARAAANAALEAGYRP